MAGQKRKKLPEDVPTSIKRLRYDDESPSSITPPKNNKTSFRISKKAKWVSGKKKNDHVRETKRGRGKRWNGVEGKFKMLDEAKSEEKKATREQETLRKKRKTKEDQEPRLAKRARFNGHCRPTGMITWNGFITADRSIYEKPAAALNRNHSSVARKRETKIKWHKNPKGATSISPNATKGRFHESQDYSSAAIAAAADNFPKSSRTANHITDRQVIQKERDQSAAGLIATGTPLEEVNDDNVGDSAMPSKALPELAGEMNHREETEEGQRAPVAFTADNLATLRRTELKDNIADDRRDDIGVLPVTSSRPTISQAPVAPQGSLFGDCLGQPCMAANSSVKFEHVTISPKAETCAIPPPSTTPRFTRNEQDLIEYFNNNYKNERVDIGDLIMEKRFRTLHPKDVSCNDQIGAGNNDDEFDDDDDDEDGTEKKLTFLTCQTWAESMQRAMAEVSRLGKIEEEYHLLIDTSINIPRNEPAAYLQYQGYDEFQIVAERTLLRYRRALDDTRYASDGSLRKECEQEDRRQYWDTVNHEVVYNDLFAYDPPMIAPMGLNRYFEEDEFEPPPQPSSTPAPPPICENTPVSNIVFDWDDEDPDIRAAESEIYRQEGRCPVIESLIQSIEDKSEAFTADHEAFTADHEAFTAAHEAFTAAHEAANAISATEAIHSQKNLTNSWKDSRAHFKTTFLEFEKNKRIIGKWSEDDHRRERKKYAETAMRLTMDSIEKHYITIPGWQNDFSDKDHDLFVQKWDGALGHIKRLRKDLEKAQILLKHSILDASLRSRVLNDDKERELGGLKLFDVHTYWSRFPARADPGLVIP
ncbi:MAG: hypothetical protein M1812_004636 [Candelaria pacifica]|nr:MAG: hypothetical protein M1812_004636 [Candelaria pacifica]